MKPQLLKVPLQTDASFSVRQDIVPYFYNRWHYHPEIELLHIQKGSGTQFVGDSIQYFEPGDVMLVGSNLPHYWRCEGIYFENRDDLLAQATVVHFKPNFWGDTFLELPENRPLGLLLERAKQGIRFRGSTHKGIIDALSRMLDTTGPQRIIMLLQILTELAESTEYELLSGRDFPNHFDDSDTDRINKIYNYSIANFTKKISLEEIASVASMSPHSFCRYFKSRNRKSYSHFLLELRIQHACKLLQEDRLSIAQICFESGFNQFSGFNKYFKLITGKSPTEYRRMLILP